MLKVLSYSSRFQNVLSSCSRSTAITRNCTESATPLLRVLHSIRDSNRLNPNFYRLAFFCSDSSSDDSESVKGADKSASGESEDTKAKSSDAILPSVFRPEDCFTVRPLICLIFNLV